MIDTSLLRLTWSVVEETQSTYLVSLTDIGIVRLLLQRISKRVLLSGEEVCLLYDYLSSKTTLIRDMADSRFVYSPPIPLEESVTIPSLEVVRSIVNAS